MRDILRKITQTGDEIYAKICEVLSVDAENLTADLRPTDGSSDVLDALLQVSENGFFVEPKVGSLVVCVFLTKETAVVVNHSELTQFDVKIENTEFQFDKDGFLLKKEDETLKELIQDLIKAIKAMKFTTNQGPTINLVNINDFISLEKRFNKLLKDN